MPRDCVVRCHVGGCCESRQEHCLNFHPWMFVINLKSIQLHIRQILNHQRHYTHTRKLDGQESAFLTVLFV